MHNGLYCTIPIFNPHMSLRRSYFIEWLGCGGGNNKFSKYLNVHSVTQEGEGEKEREREIQREREKERERKRERERERQREKKKEKEKERLN